MLNRKSFTEKFTFTTKPSFTTWPSFTCPFSVESHI